MGAIGSAIAGSAIGWFMGGKQGAVAGALGGYTSGQAESQASKAQGYMSDYYNKMYELSKEQLEWNKQLYTEWKSIFGDIQEGLSKFYMSMSPDVFAMKGIENIQQEMQNTLNQIRQNFTQRGLFDSGMEMKLEQQAMFQGAMAQAQAKTMAPFQVANERMRFLALGMNQGAQAVSSVNQAFGTGLNTLGTGVNLYGNLMGTYTQQAAQGWAGLGSYLGQLQAANAYNQAAQNFAFQQYLTNPQPMYYTPLGNPVYPAFPR